MTTITSDSPSANVTPTRGRSGRRFVVWTVGILVVGGMTISVLLPSLCRSSETANRVKCASNLRQIGQAILLYAQDHGGHYPSSLATLLPAQDLVPEVMVCPSSSDEKAAATHPADIVAKIAAAEQEGPGHEDCLSYVYVGKAFTQRAATPESIVAYEPLENHDGDGANVLFGDGNVEFYNEKGWMKIAGDAGITIMPHPRR